MKSTDVRSDLLESTCLALVVELVGQQTLHARVHSAAVRSTRLVDYLTLISLRRRVLFANE